MLPEDLDPFPGVAVDPLDLPDVPLEGGRLPDEDSGERDLFGDHLFFWLSSSDEEEEEEEDLDSEDSITSSLSEEEDVEEDVEEQEEEGEEDDQRFPPEEFWAGWRAPPAPVVEPVDLPQIPVPQQRAEGPSPAFRVPQIIFEDAIHPWDSVLAPAVPSALPSPAAAAPPVLEESSGPAPDSLPSSGSKRSRDEDDEEEGSSSKRSRLSSSEDHSEDPSPSTSTRTSGFTRRAHPPHLPQDPESDED